MTSGKPGLMRPMKPQREPALPAWNCSTHMKYLLIEDTDGPGSRVTICDTPEERNRRTLEAIFGDPEEVDKALREGCADLVTLEDERTLSFEGDPSLHWIDAVEVVSNEKADLPG